MFNFYDFNIDSAIDCVKLIYENNLCVVCDKPQICCMRFSCGHSACENCATASLGCFICLTPPEANIKPTCDAILTQQANNASQLYDSFQQAFKIDVNKRKRISEQLKIEKELFPQCIQAPIKYCNKRKSYDKSFVDKENYSSQILEEHITPAKITMMDNSINYVKNWLNKNEKNLKRKPLADLNLDNSNIKRRTVKSNKKSESSQNKKVIKNKQGKGVKRPSKTLNSFWESKNTLGSLLTIDRSKQYSNINKDVPYKKEIKEIDNNQETDESGILIDDDSSIVIEDTQLSVDHSLPGTVDKDKNALLAILEADKNERRIENLTKRAVEISQTNENIATNEFHQHYKVPYFKMSYLKETCDLYSTYISAQNTIKDESKDPSKEINITINSTTFTTTINVNNYVPRLEYLKNKKSIAIQTNISDIGKISSEQETISVKPFEIINQSKSVSVLSPDLFTVEEVPDNVEENAFKHLYIEADKSTNIIIDESDSSEDIEGSKVLEVTADIHTSGDQFEYDILNPVENIEEHGQRPRRKPRGHTPDSSNSSDKENFDPNRLKRSKTSKKCYKK